MNIKHNPHCFIGVDMRGKLKAQYRHFSDLKKHFAKQFLAAHKLALILKKDPKNDH